MKKQHYNYSYQQLINKKSNKEDNFITSSLISHVVFCFLLVVGVSFGLRLVETTINNPANLTDLLKVKTVMAAEATNQAELVEQSHKLVNIKPDQAFTFTLKYKNTGNTTWTKETVYLKSLTTALKFRHEFWPDPYLPAQLKEESVAPGEIGSFVFALQAPTNFNEYVGDFLLVDDNIMIKGGKTTVTMNVVEDPSKIVVNRPTVETTTEATNETTTNQNQILKACTLKLNISSASSIQDSLDNISCIETFNLPAEGPNIKVGLFYTEEVISIKNDKAWQIYDEAETLLASVPEGQQINIFYNETKAEYAFDFIDKTIRTQKNLILKNFNQGIFEITSYKDIPTWNKSLNYNKFSGDLMIKYNDSKERVWVIEDLPLESYLKGIKETSDPDPAEYLKTMTIAARTYSLYHVNKFFGGNSFFDVYSDERDQVYKGYNVSQTQPNLAQAVEDTKGIVATYDDEIILSYYSARSGGQTVSYNNIPYLKAVETPYTAGKTQWGHAIGIDMQDAKARADKDDWTYDELLKYYYTNINLEKIY